MAGNRKYRLGCILAGLTAVLACAAVRSLSPAINPETGPDMSSVSADAAGGAGSDSGHTVLLGGMPVGIYMETDGVMVLSTEQVRDTDGDYHDPSAGLIKTGDYITAVDHHQIEGKSDLLEAVDRWGNEEVTLTLRRDDAVLDVQMKPAEYAPGKYRLGIWVRDNVQGLGTVTFLTENNRFGALGHGIHDIDTNLLMSIDSGRVYRTSIRDITRGHSGSPGTMEGVIVYNNYKILGSIDKNTEAGIYGSLEPDSAFSSEIIPVDTARKEEIHTGDATVRCYVDNSLKEYQIRVTDIDMSGAEINKGFVIEVTDPELLEITGGIIQGMSGSPILQDGKLIGAVTHVFVQDSTKGYGIFIENMLEEAETPALSNFVSN